MALEELTEKQEKVIRQMLKAYDSQDFIDRYELLINENREVFALSKELADFLSKNKIPFVSAGLKIGEVGKRFRFSLEGAFYLARKKRKKVYVNRRGEMLFLYGRDLFAESIRKAVRVKERDVVMVCNTDGDIIGIGRSKFDGEKMRSVEKDVVVVKNLVGRGEYLRKQKLYDSF
jgi:60S ribosome subunit biogenesis protein NIP7